MTEVAKTPRHLWIVGVVSLLWNLIGVSDYTFAKLKSDWYMKEVGQFTADQIAWFYDFPLWANIGWALGVWGSLLGSVLLLTRSRHAPGVFLVSIAGLALMTFYQFGLNSAKFVALFGSGPMYFTAVIWIVVVALFLYARRQAVAGVLR